MDFDLKKYTNFLVELGTDEIPHSDTPFLAHLIGVCNLLRGAGYGESICLAGLFHSIYGTEMFQGFKLPLNQRDKVRQLIGQRAEQLAYFNCCMNRASFDENLVREGDYRIWDRLIESEVTLTVDDYQDLCRIQLYDWLEQVPRSKDWDYRRDSFRQMAQQLGPAAIKAFEETYALQSA